MNREEYFRLQAVEREHWFYAGKRWIVRHWLARLFPSPVELKILDAGAGTGELVKELRDAYPSAEVVGLEFSDVARSIAAETIKVDLVEGSILEIPFADASFDCVLALDVLEHVEDDRKAFREMLRVTRVGGALIINVPAFESLWSEWDVTLGHFRRYRRPELESLIAAEGQVETLYLSYVNSLAFLPIWAYRKLSKFVSFSERAEDRVPPRPINRLLFESFVRPATWRWFRPPVGVSLLCVLRRIR